MSLDVILRAPSGMSGNFFLFSKSSYSEEDLLSPRLVRAAGKDRGHSLLGVRFNGEDKLLRQQLLDKNL